MENIWLEEIRNRSSLGKPPVLSGRCDKLGRVGFNDLVFVPAQLSRQPVDYFRKKIRSETVIGSRSKKPLRLSVPIMFAGMSFGALSKEAKIAIARASTVLETCTNTGEGGMLPDERKEARLLVAQYSTGRFGVDDNYLRSGDAIEIKMGQGAKPGQGGLLPKEKVTPEIVSVRKLPGQMDIHSPPRHMDINKPSDLRKKVSMLRKKAVGKPIIIKIAAGHVDADVRIAVRANPDVIAIDGMSGGTGAAPEVMLDDFGIPILPAIVQARSVMDRLHAKQELIVGGGFSKGADIAKALALGADAVFLGFPLMVAMGCTYCRMCYKGTCPKGIATQDPKKRRKLKIDQASQSIVNYVTACSEEVKMAAGACGYDNVHDLSPEDLRALDFNMSRITGIKLVGD
ncbi:MAG: FMN-binding glutamate synthase family protein [Candidatus Aenigmarchaeota archaeon]|nr:FMN-binding glutamate synthase family protein [Candidatus Aenigmarchaeota archaeon]